MRSVPDYFGCLVFNDKVMKAKLPTEVYESLKKTREEGVRLDSSVANVVADAMKDWAYSLVPTVDWHYRRKAR